MTSQKTFLILALAFLSIISSNCTSPLAQEGDIVQAIESGNLEQVKHRIARNQIDVNNPLELYRGGKKASFTPLQLAASYGHADLITFFLDEGAAIEAKKAGSEKTALHLAAAIGHQAAVDALLSRGADVDAKTKKGETVLDLAKNREIKNTLIAYGATIHRQEAIVNENKEEQVSAANLGKEGVEPSPNLGKAGGDQGISANLGKDGVEPSPNLGKEGEDQGPSANLGKDGVEPSPNLGKEGEDQGPSANLGKEGVEPSPNLGKEGEDQRPSASLGK